MKSNESKNEPSKSNKERKDARYKLTTKESCSTPINRNDLPLLFEHYEIHIIISSLTRPK